MAVATDFAPPFKLIAPYFLFGVVALVMSAFLLFGVDVTNLHHLDPFILALAHLFLLGFVMMVIFGAMAQLVPVVLEVGHFAVDLYYVVFLLLGIGTLMMGIGFYLYPTLLAFGGVVVLIAFSIFLFETFATILKVKRYNFTILSVIVAACMLLIGIVLGLVMALGYSGIVEVDANRYLQAHIFFVLFGYVGMSVMGMSLVLLPMFWLSHGYTLKHVKRAAALLVLACGIVVAELFFPSHTLLLAAYGVFLLSLFSYLMQFYVLYKTRARLERDIYYYSIVVAYVSLFSSIVFGIASMVAPHESLLIGTLWIWLFGYITFIITGHLYKIVPFLVWYQKFSPLIGKQKVPMLADMVPKRGAFMQFLFMACGVFLGFLGITLQNSHLFDAAVNFFVFGALFMFKNLLYMIRFKG
ncbi:MAG: hypothetical protein AB7U44_03120 [Sulfuricurvum sp.]|jgi:hypothetical protein